MPQLFVLPLLEVSEVPARLHVLCRQNVDALSCHCCELNLIDRLAVSFVNDREALVQDLFAFFEGGIGVPMVGNEGKSKVLGEPSSNIVLDDMVAIEINTGEMGLSVFKASDDEVVVVGILIVALLVAEFGQVVSIVPH